MAEEMEELALIGTRMAEEMEELALAVADQDSWRSQWQPRFHRRSPRPRAESPASLARSLRPRSEGGEAPDRRPRRPFHRHSRSSLLRLCTGPLLQDPR